MRRYRADISAGSLMLPESRIVAALLLNEVTLAEWKQAIRGENLLQKSSPATALRQAKLIRLRLESIDRALWPLVANGDKEVATQSLFAAALAHSALLHDFVSEVVMDQALRLERFLLPREWDRFLEDCQARDASVAKWRRSTRQKLLQVVLRILAEAGYLHSTRSLVLAQPHIHPIVSQALKSAGQHQLLGVMELEA